MTGPSVPSASFSSVGSSTYVTHSATKLTLGLGVRGRATQMPSVAARGRESPSRPRGSGHAAEKSSSSTAPLSGSTGPGLVDRERLRRRRRRRRGSRPGAAAPTPPHPRPHPSSSSRWARHRTAAGGARVHRRGKAPAVRAVGHLLGLLEHHRVRLVERGSCAGPPWSSARRASTTGPAAGREHQQPGGEDQVPPHGSHTAQTDSHVTIRPSRSFHCSAPSSRSTATQVPEEVVDDARSTSMRSRVPARPCRAALQGHRRSWRICGWERRVRLA